MSDTHRMKLREPWQREVCGKRVEFRRAFHRPTNLEAHERVFVAIRAARTDGSVAVNGRPVGQLSTGQDAAFDITDLLADRNHLAIALTSAFGATTFDDTTFDDTTFDDTTFDDTALPFAETAIEIRQQPAGETWQD